MPKRIKFFPTASDRFDHELGDDSMHPLHTGLEPDGAVNDPAPPPAPEVVVAAVPEPETHVVNQVEHVNKEEPKVEMEHIISEDEYSSWFTKSEPIVIGEDAYLPEVIGSLAVAYETAPRTNKNQTDFPKYDQATLNGIDTVSGKIRYLHSRGLTKGQIAKVLGKLYQHVRAVLNQPTPKKGW
jgi:hypothetical protein